jgi:hypothetical protein
MTPSPSLIAREEEATSPPAPPKLALAPELAGEAFVFVAAGQTTTDAPVYGPFESASAAREWAQAARIYGAAKPLTAPSHRALGGDWS